MMTGARGAPLTSQPESRTPSEARKVTSSARSSRSAGSIRSRSRAGWVTLYNRKAAPAAHRSTAHSTKTRNRKGPEDKNDAPFFAIGGGLYHRAPGLTPFQTGLDPLSQAPADRLGDRFEGRLAHPLHRAEAAQQQPGAAGADPFDRRQLGGQQALRTRPAVVGDGETVRLVADSLDQMQDRRVVRETHRIPAPVQEDLLLTF